MNRQPPPEIDFSPQPTDNKHQPDSDLHKLGNEVLTIIFENLNSSDHCSLRQTSITFYHVLHSMYHTKVRLMITSATFWTERLLVSYSCRICLRQSTELPVDLASSQIVECNFDLQDHIAIRRHVILLRHAIQVTQLIVAEFWCPFDNFPENTAFLIASLAETVQLQLVKLIRVNDAVRFNNDLIRALRRHSDSLRHFSFFSLHGHTRDVIIDLEYTELFRNLPELYIGPLHMQIDERLLSGVLNSVRRLGFYQRYLSDIIRLIEHVQPNQANLVSHLTIRSLNEQPFEMTDLQRNRIRAKFPNAIIL